MDFEQNSGLHDRLLKSRRLHARIRVTGNATPANKTHNPELPEAIKLKTEGKDDVTGSDAAASTDMGAKVDANGTLGVLLLASEIGNIERVLGSSVKPTDGGSCTIADVNTGTTSYGLTAAGNIALDLDSSRSMATQDIDVTISIDYLRAPN